MGAFSYSSAGAGILPEGSVSDAELAIMVALSIKGNPTNASASPQDIVASANGQFLGRTSDALSFQAITGALVSNTPSGNLVGVTVQAAIDELEAGKAKLAFNNTYTANTHTYNFTSNGSLSLNGDDVTCTITQTRFGNNATSPIINSRKARGSQTTPLVVATNDSAGVYNFTFYDGSGYTTGARLTSNVIETTPSSTAMATRPRFLACAVGSTTLSDLVAWDHTNGQTMFGTSNIVIDANRILRPRSYTISTLPTITTTGIIHCSDLGPTASSAGSGLLMSNGTNWVRVSQSGVESIASDAAYDATWQYLTNAPTIRGAASMTADRTYTLGTTNVVVGARVRVARLNTSAFNWSIVGLTTAVLARSGDWVEFEYSLAGWILTAHNLSKPSGVATISTDANHTATYSVYGGADHVRGNATLTATRTYTLGTTGAKNGDRVTITRLGTGAFNWDIVGSTTVSLTATKQWVTFEYDGSAWNMAAGGTIP